MDQINSEIEDNDLPSLASQLDMSTLELLFCKLNLTPAEEADVRRLVTENGTQIAGIKCFKLWKKHTPSEATYQQFLSILLSQGVERIDVAKRICSLLMEQNSKLNLMMSLVYIIIMYIYNLYNYIHFRYLSRPRK